MRNGLFKECIAAIITLLLLYAAPSVCQDEIDEDALFGDTSMIIDSKEYIDSGNIVDEKQEKSVSVSGSVTGSAIGSLLRRYFEESSASNTSFGGSIVGSFNGDIRLPMSVKSFINTEVSYDGAADSVEFFLRELFLDWNFNYNAFFRIGKQVLQWGRGFFFNPVDLVNVEKTRFFNELSSREGTFGLKVHVPFQTKANLYSFLDMGNSSHIDSLALAVKAEFLLGPTEFAFSVWGKKNVDPVYGFDFSTGVGNFSVVGEAALYQSLDTFSLAWEDSLPKINQGKAAWIPRVSIGIGRYFDFGEINDRILVNIEGYYNHTGKKESDLTPYIPEWFEIEIEDAAMRLYQMMPSSILAPNTLSQWYAAAFITISRFIVTDMTLTTSVLFNVNHRCAMITSAVNYTTLHNLSFDLIVNGFPGRDYTEYTLLGQGMTVEGRIGILF